MISGGILTIVLFILLRNRSEKLCNDIADIFKRISLCKGILPSVFIPLDLHPLVASDRIKKLVGLRQEACRLPVITRRFNGLGEKRRIGLARFCKNSNIIEIARTRIEDTSGEYGLDFLRKNGLNRVSPDTEGDIRFGVFVNVASKSIVVRLARPKILETRYPPLTMRLSLIGALTIRANNLSNIKCCNTT